MTRPRALVIGGSLGGLFAASLMRAIGWDAVVFERVEGDLGSRGAGIGTREELFAVMQRIGACVDDTIGVEVTQRICLDRAGAIVHEVTVPQFMSAWARIYRPLKAALPSDCYRSGMPLASVEQDVGTVTAVFADGSRERGDLLIGTDGIHSTVRQQLIPEAQPLYAGYVAWRGVIEERRIAPATHALLFEKYTFCLPEGEMMLSYPVPGRDNDVRAGHRDYNFVWYRPVARERLPDLCTDAVGRQHGVSIPPPLIRREIIEAMRADARALLAPQIAEIVGQVTEPFFQPIFDLESPRLVFGRVVLLGDAAFVARPHVGAGVTKAALDAQSLAQAIAEAAGDLPSALARYDRERRHFGAQLVARARRLGAYLEAQSKPPEQRTESERTQRPEVVMREIGAALFRIEDFTPGV